MKMTINRDEKLFQTYELMTTDDFYTGKRLYKLVRRTRDSSGKIIKSESAKEPVLEWVEQLEGDPSHMFLRFDGAEMEDYWREKRK